MDFNYLTLDYWQTLNHPEAWSNIMIALATLGIALTTLFGVIIAAWITNRFSKNQAKRRLETQSKIDRLKREIDALEKIWSIMQYITLFESKHAILRWRDPKKDKSIKNAAEKNEKSEKRKYFIQFQNLQDFLLIASMDAYYAQHAGLHLPNHIRDLLFEYQGSLMGFYFANKDKEDLPEDNLIEVKNKYLSDKLKQLSTKLNNGLKTAMEERYQQMDS